MNLYMVKRHGFNSMACNGLVIEDLTKDLKDYNDFFYVLDFIIVVLVVLWIFDIIAFFFGTFTEEIC